MPRSTRAAARAEADVEANVPQDCIVQTSQPLGTTVTKDAKKKRNKNKKGNKTANVIVSSGEEPAPEGSIAGDSTAAEVAQEPRSIGKESIPLVIAASEEQSIPSSPLRRSNRRKAQELAAATSAKPEESQASNVPEHQLTSSPEPGSDNAGEELAQIQTENNQVGHEDPLLTHTSEAVQELESVFQRPPEAEYAEDDSAITDIIGRTPAKRTPSTQPAAREDPIEALDALEDALDEVGQSLPSLNVSKKSPPGLLTKGQISTTKAASTVTKESKLTRQSSVKPVTNMSSGSSGLKRQSSVRQVAPKPATKGLSVVHRQSVARQASPAHARPGAMRATSSATTKSTVSASGPAISRSPKVVSENRQRSAIAALQTPPPAVKSTKPLTKPVFQLPGEAMAVKLKAQREERMKRQEEAAAARLVEAKNRTTGKPKPTEVRQMAATAARKSILAERNKNSDDGLRASSTTQTKRPLSMAPQISSTVPRTSTVSSRPKSMLLTSSAGGSATENRSQPTSIHLMSNQGLPRAARPGGTIGHVPKRTASVSGKEVANRARSEQKAKEQEIKDKAEAAKKARAEAAERGRQASKEWAEKMMKKNKALALAARKEESSEPALSSLVTQPAPAVK